jgi:hypothetical protein
LFGLRQLYVRIAVDKGDIYLLKDRELARALYLAAKDVPHLLRNDWERDFAKGIEEAYVKFGGFTWKQRRCARQLLIRIAANLARRAEVRGVRV